MLEQISETPTVRGGRNLSRPTLHEFHLDAPSPAKEKEAAQLRIVQHQPRDDPEAKLKLT
ncbi:hypothetical protein DA101_024395 [Sinorhizobium meliloti]|nr:hypothetical protein DA101_024395 [Sinorhizobium meliloti]